MKLEKWLESKQKKSRTLQQKQLKSLLLITKKFK